QSEIHLAIQREDGFSTLSVHEMDFVASPTRDYNRLIVIERALALVPTEFLELLPVRRLQEDYGFITVDEEFCSLLCPLDPQGTSVQHPLRLQLLRLLLLRRLIRRAAEQQEHDRQTRRRKACHADFPPDSDILLE